jgi:hypothetical protein
MFSFDPTSKLVLGLLTGLAFGFLLQRGGVTRYRVILGQFLLKDHTVLKTMLTAVVVGSAGVYALHQFGGYTALGEVALHVKSTAVLGNILGGLIFGVGMVLLGYCPGTGVAALGDGSRHAIPGLFGMLAGAAIYAEAYPAIKGSLLTVLSYGKITLPGVLQLSPWLFVVGLAIVAVGLFSLLRRFEAKAAATK